jgi:hypothetical protein
LLSVWGQPEYEAIRKWLEENRKRSVKHMLKRRGQKLKRAGMESEPARRERVRRSRAEITELVAAYRQSGQKQQEFCQHWAGRTSERCRYDHSFCSG